MNGVLAARTQSFEDAREQLREELVGDRAARIIDKMRDDIDDLLASGATLEEVAKETDMKLAQIDWTRESSDDIAGYAAFQTEASKVKAEDFPELIALEDGGIFALRLNEVVAPELQTLDAVRADVVAAWKVAETSRLLMAQAEALLPKITPDADMAALGLTVTQESALTRTDFIDKTPRDFLDGIFAMEPGTARTFATPGGAIIVRLDAVNEPDPTSPEVANALQALKAQTANGQAQDLYQFFVNDVQTRAGLQLDQNAINAVLTNFQ
ncbi:hypothetical protein N4R57_08845 [Rhodobacteraceae bacterium D3-12]|nr:hypothetical protein N4R57_08845 [Rhodobacteraceae bacterium D3-12]